MKQLKRMYMMNMCTFMCLLQAFHGFSNKGLVPAV